MMSDFCSPINHHDWETCQHPNLRDSWSCNTLPAPGCGVKAKFLLIGAGKAYLDPLEITNACTIVAGYIKQSLAHDQRPGYG